MAEEREDRLLPLKGEGGTPPPTTPFSPRFLIEEVIKEKKLTFEEASQALSMLGKDESGVRYAYLMLTATDKKLTDIRIILNFKHVLFLDISGNLLSLEALQVVTEMPFLVLLKAERNRIEAAALKPMPFLQVLVLNRNQISETCDINQPMLESLELHFNHIFTAQFDTLRLANLKQLELRGNQLMDISGNYPISVEKLYIAVNRIKKINAHDFGQLTNLKLLHMRDNLLRKLNGFTDQQANLTYLNLRNNKINKLRQFRKLKCLPKLETLIILGNPVQGEQANLIKGEDDEDEDEEMYGEDQGIGFKTDPIRIGLLVLLPGLKRINKKMVTMEEREVALESSEERLEEIMKEESSDEEPITEAPTTTDFSTSEYTSETEKEEEFDEDEEEEDR